MSEKCARCGRKIRRIFITLTAGFCFDRRGGNRVIDVSSKVGPSCRMRVYTDSNRTTRVESKRVEE